ncbi:translation initiation factor IF-2 [Rhodocytophaga aerolata]|uniref:Translation initiation factor IF-2 n=1 Tax=Rhodocytophaga aerolata TaxID=455078 RepID=A0ABT8R2H8_9BACT|nr:translation initiation factor IF-2 [Rhodocytophaga aerolata]MDO1446301.1 translation initiation factor IF-2 [Rhodocytophaga aerolata]
MAEEKMMRLSQVARQLNVGISTIAEHLAAKGFVVENNPNSKISQGQFEMLAKEFKSSALEKREASGLNIGKKHTDNVVINNSQPEKEKKEDDLFVKPAPVIEKESKESAVVADTSTTINAKKEDAERAKLPGFKVLGKIDLDNRGNVVRPAVTTSVTPPAATPTQSKEAPLQEPVKPVEKAPVVEVKTQSAPVEVPKKEEKVAEPVAQEQKPVQEEKPAPVAVVTPPVKETPTVEKEEIKAPQPVTSTTETAPVEPAKETQERISKAKNIPTPVVEEKPKVVPQIPIQKEEQAWELVTAKADQLKGLTVLGKIELPTERDKNKKKPTTTPTSNASADDKKKNKRKRKRVRIGGDQPADQNATGDRRPPIGQKPGEQSTPGQRPPYANNDRSSFAGKSTTGTGDNRPNQNRPGFGNRPGQNRPGQNNRPIGKPLEKEEVSDKQIQDQIKATLAKLSGNKNTSNQSNRAKYRGQKRSAVAAAREERLLQEQEESKVLKVTEFISANDLASLMGVSVNEVISVCMNLGMFVSINQRLDAEAITVISDEFGYDVEFASTEEETDILTEEEDKEEDLEPRAPIVTIMGHVDHGKTSLLDYIRRSKVAAGESGGITQHIGAYDVTTDTGKRIAFLDTPGHEAFTAMRARGAKVTDIVIIVVAADDNVMPQTKEAINHAQVAGVPIVIAINKVDKPNANPEKIKEELAKENILVEDWGGKYQSEEISAKTGKGVPELLEKVLLEAELLDLKANANKKAVGTVIEASLDKGRGYVTTVLVQSGTLRIGDILLAGAHYGRVKAMTDHRGKRLKTANPSTPVQVLGLSGAPQAGDKFNVLETEREAREIANKREQIQREQSIRTKKHITLDEIGRRLAIGSFKELNVIVKGDVDGSVEALSDSLLNLSTNEVQVRIIHKGVGQISESDVLLASASDAVIVGFQVRPSVNARRLAEQEEIEVRLYSIIYDAINDVKDAMEGMLAPKVEEIITGNVEVRDVFKITKVGTVAGCYVTEGVIKRNSKIRVVRDGIVVHTGEIDALKRFKDDVSEVKYGYECGMSVKNFNDIQVGDNIEAFEQKETKRTL